MAYLNGHRVLALETAYDSALARFFVSLGADVVKVTCEDMKENISGASFLMEQFGLSRLAEKGWSRQRIEQDAPKLVHVSVTTFGSEGPYAGWKGGELIASAMSGVLLPTGDSDRAPVKEALDACSFHADMVAAAGALAAHYERDTSGLGQHVDVSVQEVALSRQFNNVLGWQFDGRKLHRAGGALNYGNATVRCIWPLSDGWCFHSLMPGRFGAPANQALSDWMDEAGFPNPFRGTDWLKYDRSLDMAIRAEWEKAIEAFFRTRTEHEIATEGRKRGINATVAADPGDVTMEPHLAARNFWREENGLRVPSRFVRIHVAEPVPQRSSGANIENGDQKITGSRPGPLAGVRVLDFSWALVGSVTTKTMGDLGAEIVKVESRSRPCLSRIDVQVSVSKRGSFDDKPMFSHLNSSKYSLALDMKKPESREVLTPLIKWADVVVENFSPGTMTKLGLDYAALKKINPGLVMVSGSVYGQTGPFAQEWGIDGTGAALSGRTYMTGWPDRDPVIPVVPFGDVILPYAMVGAVGAALQYRRETGRGGYIDASMYEICVQQMHDAILQVQQGDAPRRMGNRDSRLFHQGVYPVSGEDRWVAISLDSEVKWQQFREFASLPEAEGADERDAIIAAWTSNKTDKAIVAELQQAGIAAGVVQDIEDVIETDPQIAARGSLVPIEHPLLGKFGHIRTPISFSRSEVEMFRAPGIGEHSRSIAENFARLSKSHIDELESLGVFR